jgi:preprotein translocase subunit SecY
MISAFINSIKVPELRSKLFYTLGLLFIARIGANIPLPGLDPTPLKDFFVAQNESGGGNLLGFYNMFTGGAFLKGAICALGIMPYISASIIFQLMTAIVPSLVRLRNEGETGRQKIGQYTRYATVLICLVQASLLSLALQNPARLFPGFSTDEYGSIVIASNPVSFVVISVIILTTGTVLLMWLGEQITKQGIGNGISLLIAVGILSDMPGAAMLTVKLFSSQVGVKGLGLPQGVLMLGLLFIVVAGIVAVTQAQRKIPLQYAKRVVGRKIYGGQSSFLPLKINYSGVMPIIFASALLMFFQQITTWLGVGLDWPAIKTLGNSIQYGKLLYYILYALLILGFSYFWVSVMFKPIQIADDLKKHGGYIPGVRPGEPTAKFLDFVMTRLTFAGAIFLTVIAVIPSLLLSIYDIPYLVAQFFGGTGMLIIVGVVLDTLRQVETHLLQRHYDGFLRKGRIRGRSVGRTQTTTTLQIGEIKNLGKLWTLLGIIFVFGLMAWLLQILWLD